MAELRAGRPVQLFVTDVPRIKFHPAPLCGVSVPSFRAFRQYYSPFF